jgi:DNA-binding response OmpR family regulator
MFKPRILIVEDDFDIANMLKIYFTGQNYEAEIASRGVEALEKTRQVLPNLIILDILLPDKDGYEVCRTLRVNSRTSHIPVIFLTQKDERSDKLQGLELGVDDYITKPFDIDELKLRVQNAIARAERESLTDPHSGLPSGRLIEEQFRRIIHHKDWTMLDVRINYFDAFKEVYGFVTADEAIRLTAKLLGEVVDKFGTLQDFIGHAGSENFTIITTEAAAQAIYQNLKERFKQEILTLYNFTDREQGFIMAFDQSGQSVKTPLMTLAIGIVPSSQYDFADIREITEIAAEARRKEAIK